MRQEGIVQAARAWIGTPYHDQASLKGVGCDCLGLLRGVWRELIGPEPVDMRPYARDVGEAGAVELIANPVRGFMDEIAVYDRQPGDVLLFRMPHMRFAKHCAFQAGPGMIIHAYERRGVVEMRMPVEWRGRIAFVFRFPDLVQKGVT
ncbi:peptidase [Pelagimonas varians]|uniref:peptidase n=1 Tax=Pelagimonas varians TaxID=696760 RepID=UPI001FE3346C|nr:peptidase [Pelagimonas varians]